jgi:hypothetical protein
MSQRPISRSADLKRLRDEGYDLEIRSGCLLVKNVPYVNSGKEVRRGILVIKLVLAGDQTVRPDTHVAYFSGDHPSNEDGSEIAKIKHSSNAHSLAEGVAVNHSFSAKPNGRAIRLTAGDRVTTWPRGNISPGKRRGQRFSQRRFRHHRPTLAEARLLADLEKVVLLDKSDMLTWTAALGAWNLVGIS